MKIRRTRFNIYLLLVSTLVGGLIACRTPEERKHAKEASTFRLYVEERRDGSTGSGVPIYRANPIHVSVGREPILTEADVDSAAVIDLPGGYGIQVQFNGHGALVLEGVTVGRKGKHFAIQSDFGESRWLAAPLINQRISNGQVTFTPDATRDEAERIVRGLNNVVKKMKQDSKYLGGKW